MEEASLMQIRDLDVYYRTLKGYLKAVDKVNFDVHPGEVVGLVGESGCGKSTVGQTILRLFDEKKEVKYDGGIFFKDRDILKLSQKDLRNFRGNEASMVFQDALSALNPVMTVEKQLTEPIRRHLRLDKKQAYEKALQLLELTGIPDPEVSIKKYPHELSGGQRQRIMIAIALSCNPKLLIADEPTTALDVTIKAQIIDLLLEMNEKLKMGVIFITHDLAVVAEICHRVVVMYLGQIVEEGNTKEIFERPSHPYTKGLIHSIPQIEKEKPVRLYMISGSVPSLNHIPQGCRFAPRCPYADENCTKQCPELKSIGETHKCRCLKAGLEEEYVI